MATDRWNDAKHGTDQKSAGNQRIMDTTPTSAAEQYERGGFTRLETPVGDNGPCIPGYDGYPLSGTAGGSKYNIAAEHPAYEQG